MDARSRMEQKLKQKCFACKIKWNLSLNKQGKAMGTKRVIGAQTLPIDSVYLAANRRHLDKMAISIWKFLEILYLR